MRLSWLVPSLLCATLACSSDDAPTELLPGPCSAKRTFGDGQTGTCEITYDVDDRPLTASCTLTYEGGSWTDELSRSYAEDGSLAAITTAEDDSGNTYDDTWQLDGATLTHHGVSLAYDSLTHNTEDEAYEVDFAGLRWVSQDPFARPSADDALVAYDGVREEGEYDPSMIFETHTTYTYEGELGQGTRTRTGSDGSERVFTYDDDGNLVGGQDDSNDDAFVYDEDGRLIEWQTQRGTLSYTLTYAWDEFGNLVGAAGTDPQDPDSGYETAFDYSCW